jgi:hypothetical protein
VFGVANLSVFDVFVVRCLAQVKLFTICANPAHGQEEMGG